MCQKKCRTSLETVTEREQGIFLMEVNISDDPTATDSNLLQLLHGFCSSYPKCVETRELSQISYVDSVSCYGVFTNRVIVYEWKFPRFVSNFRTTTYGYTENSNEKSSEIIQIRATRLN